MKKCTGCKTEYPATPKYFNRNIATKDGLATRCKTCTREYGRNYWRKKNKVEKERIRIIGNEEGLPIEKIYGTQYRIGKNYKVEWKARGEGTVSRIGKLIQETNDFIVLESKSGVRESFLKKDFYLGTKIKELS